MNVVLASGNGTNFEAIVNYGIQDLVLICDNPEAPVINRAKKLKVPFYVIDPKRFETRSQYNDMLACVISKYSPELVILAGYMKIIPENIVNKYRILNIHPALLPSFKGNNGISDAFEYGVKISGITIHLVDAKVDEGQIVFQYPLFINECWDYNEYENQIHKLEHRYYPEVIEKVLRGEI